jgi:hypothetical protein
MLIAIAGWMNDRPSRMLKSFSAVKGGGHACPPQKLYPAEIASW